MAFDKILIAEDEPVSAKILQTILSDTRYDVTFVEDGLAAFNQILKNDYSLLITDINMPKMNGFELIQNINNSEKDPIIIVQSAIQELEHVIEIMKHGVFDYIIKPLNKDDLLFKIDKAEENYRLKKVNQVVEKEKEIRIKNQISVKNSVENILNKNFDRFDEELFHNIRTGFSQGAGFGGLIALISLIKTQAKKSDNSYIIDASLMNLIIENSKMAEKALKAFQEIDNIIKQKFDFEDISLFEFHNLIQEVINKQSIKLKFKNQHIKISENNYKNYPQKISINKKLIIQAFEELFINAMKYSKDDTYIMIFLNISDTFTSISILNQSVKNDSQREYIPEEYSRLIFEPFFRLTKTVDERYGTLEFGLGLTIVEKIIRKHNGKISISQVQNYTDIEMASKSMVNFEIILPIKK